MLGLMIAPVSDIFGFAALYHLRRAQQNENRTLMRLASGRRILSGSDDPAELIASTQLDAALERLAAESEVVQRRASFAGMADGHLSQLGELSSRLQGALVAGAGAQSAEERAAHQLEIDQIIRSMQRFASEAGAGLPATGVDDAEGMQTALRDAASSLTSLLSGGAHRLEGGALEEAQRLVRDAGATFASTRGQIGSHQRYNLEARVRSLAAERENLTDANSHIRDADFAEETSNLSRARLLTQASIRALGVFHRDARSVLALLEPKPDGSWPRA
jgi:flagellin